MEAFITSHWGKRIEPIEVERFTASTVFYTENGRPTRSPRIGQYNCYFETKDAAKAHLIGEIDRKKAQLKLQIEHLISERDLISKL